MESLSASRSPWAPSAPQSIRAPLVMSTFTPVSVTSYVGSDSGGQKDSRYSFSFSDSGYASCRDDYTQLPMYCAGEHLLQSVTPTVYQNGTGHQLPGLAVGYSAKFEESYYDSTQTLPSNRLTKIGTGCPSDGSITDCVGDNWIPPTDNDLLDFYHTEFRGFMMLTSSRTYQDEGGSNGSGPMVQHDYTYDDYTTTNGPGSYGCPPGNSQNDGNHYNNLCQQNTEGSNLPNYPNPFVSQLWTYQPTDTTVSGRVYYHIKLAAHSRMRGGRKRNILICKTNQGKSREETPDMETSERVENVLPLRAVSGPNTPAACWRRARLRNGSKRSWRCQPLPRNRELRAVYPRSSAIISSVMPLACAILPSENQACRSAVASSKPAVTRWSVRAPNAPGCAGLPPTFSYTRE